MIKQIVLIITVSAISALTVFGQYFSRVYYDDLRSRRGYSVFPINHVFIVKAFSLHGNIEWVSKIIKIE